MKLTYRGVSYDRNPSSLEVMEGDILGKYRGQVIRSHAPAAALNRPEVESMLLHYRGCVYPQMTSVVKLSTPVKRQAPAASCPVQSPTLSTFMNRDVRQVHIENMRNSLEARIRTAQAHGDERLVNLLQRESSQLWPSHQN
ncbi:MAG: DUF4278 domain-containing protein [Limnothrix sp.]